METENITVDVQVRVDVYVHGKKQEEGGSIDRLTVWATLFYLLGFAGMFIMLLNIPTHFLYAGIIAAVIYTLPLLMVVLALILKPKVMQDVREFAFFDKDNAPITYHLVRLLTGGGSTLRGFYKNVLKNFIAPFAFFLFNVLLALFWMGYTTGSLEEAALIGIVIPGAYSIYYYPFILIRYAKKHQSKLMGGVSALVILASLATYLVNYDRFMATDSVIGLAVLFTMLTVLGTLTILITNLILAKKKKGKACLLALYLLLLAGVVLVAL